MQAHSLIAAVVISMPAIAAGGEHVDYNRDIKPVLKAKCYSCHGALKQEAGLRVDTVELMQEGGDSGTAIDADDLLQSLILERVSASDPDERMPPEGEPLSPEQLARFRQWLSDGARAPKDEKPQEDPKSHWSFQPLNAQSRSAVPAETRHAIDHFINARLKQANLRQAKRADAVTLIRRMFLDLHGLPPTPDDIDRWTPLLSNDGTAKQSARKLVDELLSSPRYGERWAQHWLDIVRYADTHGYEVNTPRPNAWPYRDYVIDAFNSDTPYDRFVTEQLAGDTVDAPAATGFMVAAAALLPGQIGKDDESKRLARQDELDEIIVGTSATFLGLTVGCARCHDHKFDLISQKDYYGLQAFFAGVKYGDRELRDDVFAQNVAKADALKPKLNALRSQLESHQPKAFSGRTIIIDDEDLDRVTLLAEKNGHGANPDGGKRGYRNDVGDAERIGNLSRGRYTWWTNKPGEDVFTWNPSSAGRFRIWVSWGVHGSGVHTNDARYVLDRDGDLATHDDQQEIATANQHYFVGVTEGETEKKPMWSGLLDTGVHELTAAARIVLRCGETKTGITADVIVLQEETESEPTALAAGTTDEAVITTRGPTPERSTRRIPHLRKAVDFDHNVENFKPTKAKFVRFTSFATVDDDRHQPCVDELEVFSTYASRGNVALATRGTVPTSSGNYSTVGKHQLKHVNDGRYSNDFSWISNEHGRGWVQLEFSQLETIDRIEWGRDRTGQFKDRLSIDYQIETSLDGQIWTYVAGSGDREPRGTPHDENAALRRNNSGADPQQLEKLTARVRKLEKQQQQLRTPRKVFAGQFGTPEDTFLLNRGDPEQRVEKMAPHILTSLSAVTLPEKSADIDRRTALARWIASPNNPLTARVMVNRIWQYHFGIGLVETSSDFGLNGARPSHPGLLDWLAQEFIDSGWSVKHMHRLIMSSATYQQASAVDAAFRRRADEVDANNRLLWHFPSRRLEAEAIRDCILQISGKLNLEMGGPGFDFFKTRGGLSGFPPVEEFSDKQMKRMIYAHKIRMEPVPIFGAFDCPDAGLPTPKRSQSTTAIQALNLFNSEFVIAQAEFFAKHVAEVVKTFESAANKGPKLLTSSATNSDLATLAFRLALGRLPNRREHEAGAEVVETYGLATLCRVLFNSNEFLFLP